MRRMTRFTSLRRFVAADEVSAAWRKDQPSPRQHRPEQDGNVFSTKNLRTKIRRDVVSTLGVQQNSGKTPWHTGVSPPPETSPDSRVGAGKQQGCYESTAPRNSQEGWMVSRKTKATTECPQAFGLFPYVTWFHVVHVLVQLPKTMYPIVFPSISAPSVIFPGPFLGMTDLLLVGSLRCWNRCTTHAGDLWEPCHSHAQIRWKIVKNVVWVFQFYSWKVCLCVSSQTKQSQQSADWSRFSVLM